MSVETLGGQAKQKMHKTPTYVINVNKCGRGSMTFYKEKDTSTPGRPHILQPNHKKKDVTLFYRNRYSVALTQTNTVQIRTQSMARQTWN